MIVVYYPEGFLLFWSQQPPWKSSVSDFSFIWPVEDYIPGQTTEPATLRVGDWCSCSVSLIIHLAYHPIASFFLYFLLSLILEFQDSSGKSTFSSSLPLKKIFFSPFFPHGGHSSLSNTWDCRFFTFGGMFCLLVLKFLLIFF